MFVPDRSLQPSLMFEGKTAAYPSRAQCYKTFYIVIYDFFVISLSVCPWQAFPA